MEIIIGLIIASGIYMIYSLGVLFIAICENKPLRSLEFNAIRINIIIMVLLIASFWIWK